MLVCAGRNETFSYATTIGVGLIESAINLTQICLEKKPEFIIFIGSAGSYGEYEVFDIIEANKAANMELAFLNEDAYTPLDKILEDDNSLTKSEAIVNSSNYISTNKQLSSKYLEHGIGLENMEFFSILQVAKQFKIPVAGIFVITNYTDKNAHKDFISNHKVAMEKLENYLLEKKLIK